MIPVAIIPLIMQLLSIGLKVADIIEKSKDIADKDKEALRAIIKKSRDGVTYITDENTEEGN